DGVIGGLISLLRAGEAAAIDAVVEGRINQRVPLVDLGAQKRRIVIRIVARDAAELAVEHADDLGGLVVDDTLRLFVPQGRHRDLAGIVRIARAISLMQVAKAVDAVGLAFGEARILAISPALIFQAGDGMRDGYRAFELLERAEDQRAMRP